MGKKFEIESRYTYLDLTFILSRINMLLLKIWLRKTGKHGFQNKKMLSKSKEKTIDT